MKITVIIPTYGMPRFLDKAIQSVLNQTFQDWEMIIVDDNNPNTEARNATESIVMKYTKRCDRIQYIKHPRNRNGAVARNTGIAQAKGEYIAFLDSDDEYLPERLEKCCRLLDQCDSHVAGVYTGCEFRKQGKIYNVFTKVRSGNFLVETLACNFMFCTGSNIFVRRSVVDEINGFDETFLRHQDYEFLVRIFEKYSLKAIPEVLVIKNNENFNVPSLKKIIEIKNQYLTKFASQIKILPLKQKKYIYQSQYIAIAESGMRLKEYKVANIYYKKAQKYGRLSIKVTLRRIGFCLKNLIGR